MSLQRKIDKGDHEFLPAALEMLETPPSPVRMALLLAICALFVVAAAWSWIGKVDIVAIANGKIQPSGRVRVVQPIEGGKVLRLKVSNGQIVAKDDVLIELSPDDAKADVQALLDVIGTINAEIAWRYRLAAAIRSRNLTIGEEPKWPPGISSSIRTRESRVYRNTSTQLATAIAAFLAQKEQKKAELAKLKATVAAQKVFVRTLQDRVDMREILVKRNAGSRASLIDALEKLHEQQTNLSSQAGKINETSSAIIALDREIAHNYETAAADNSQKFIAAERQRDELGQRLAKAQTKLSCLQIKAPVAGSVQALSIINPGQVISAGKHIMRIVLADAEMEVEAFDLNKDIGFIKVGQTAVIKIESFPLTRYGTIEPSSWSRRHAAPAKSCIPDHNQTKITQHHCLWQEGCHWSRRDGIGRDQDR